MRLNELMNMQMQAGLVLENGESLSFEVEVGDVLFFPMGSQHYLKSGCPDGILLVLGYSTGNMVGLWGLYGVLWGSMGSIGVYGALWVAMGSIWGPIGSSWVLWGSVGSYWVLWGSMEPYGVYRGL